MKRRVSFSHARRDVRFAARRGFTLIEVMLSLALLVLLLGGLFGTVRATVRTTVELREGQRVEQGVYGLFELCRRTFVLLPPAASVIWSDSGNAAAPLPEIALRNAPDAFAMGREAFFPGEIALATRRDKNGGLTLGIAYRRLDSVTGQPLPDPVWLPLLKDVETARWDFLDSASGQWQPTWLDPLRHPSLIRLALTFPGDDRKWSEVFWLPPMAPVALPAAVTAAATNGISGANGPNGTPGTPNTSNDVAHP